MVTKKALATCRNQAPKGTLKSAWESMLGGVAYAVPSHNTLRELFCVNFASYFCPSSEDPTIVPAWDTFYLVDHLSESESVIACELALADDSLVTSQECSAEAEALAQDLADCLAKQESLVASLEACLAKATS